MDTQTCQTCFDGLNHATDDEIYPWGPCDKCGARALNGAQLRDIGIITNDFGQALVGACLGARKTGTTVGFINRNRGVWLGVVPLHTMDSWEAAINEWSPGTKVYRILAGNKTGLVDLEESPEDAVHLIGWELARRQDFSQYKNIEGGFLDEVHRMAGFDTATSKAIRKLNTRYRIALSGTPARNKLHNLWNVLHWIWWGNNDHKTKLRLRRYKTRGMFSDGTPGWLYRHFHMTEQKVMGLTNLPPIVGRELRVGSVIEEIPCYIQHLEEETCCEFHPGGVNATLPPVEEPKIIEVDMTPAQKKIYTQLSSNNAIMWLDDQDGERKGMYIGDEEKVRRLRKRQVTLAVPTIEKNERGEIKVVMKDEAKSSVLDGLLSLLEDIAEPGDPVMVYTHSAVFARMAVKRINKRFGNGFAFEWTGEVPLDQRNHVKDNTFGKEGGPLVIVASIASIAEGTDGLQLVCRREVHLSIDEDDMLNTQLVGRLRRTGQRRRIQSWWILVRDSSEAAIIKTKFKNRAKLKTSLRAV